MCENCDPEDFQPSELASHPLAEREKNYWFALRVLSFYFKFLAALGVFYFFCHRLNGEATTRPGPDRGVVEATYPYTYDELEPEFDQRGRGIFFLPASTTGDNAKNTALRQNFGSLYQLLIRLAAMSLTLSVAEMALLFHLFTARGNNILRVLSGGGDEWHRHTIKQHQKNQSKSSNPRRNKQILLLVLCCAILPAAQLGLSNALLVTETSLVNGIRTDPIIVTYLEQIRRNYPKITSEDIHNSLERCLGLAWSSLASTVLSALMNLAILVWMRRLPCAGLRHRDSIVGITLAEESQVSVETEAEWEDTGPLARAHKRQLDNVEGDIVAEM